MGVESGIGSLDIRVAIGHHNITMRTTLSLDDDVIAMAKSLAEARRISLGEAVSFLARRGASVHRPMDVRNGFHVFSVEEGSPNFGPQDINAALEADDQGLASGFWKPSR